MIKKLPLEEFKSIYTRVPRLCVDLIIKDGEKVLLTKRDIPPMQGYWHFPGGTVLMGETFEDTIQRVAQEELNAKVKVVKQIGVLEYFQSVIGQCGSIVYLVEPLSEMEGGEQAREINFFSTPPDGTLPELREFLERNVLKI